VNRITEFSPCRLYRYTLWREWEASLPYTMFIGLNPSTADETKDDPTIRRCIEFSKSFGHGSLCMTNLFAWRDTKPENMKLAKDPIGPENNDWLEASASAAGVVIAAWGKHGAFMGRGVFVKGLIRPWAMLMCLRTNKDGSPEHPLYLPKTLTPIPYP